MTRIFCELNALLGAATLRNDRFHRRCERRITCGWLRRERCAEIEEAKVTGVFFFFFSAKRLFNNVKRFKNGRNLEKNIWKAPSHNSWEIKIGDSYSVKGKALLRRWQKDARENDANATRRITSNGRNSLGDKGKMIRLMNIDEVNLHKFGGSKAEQIEWGGNGTIDPGYSPVRFSPLTPFDVPNMPTPFTLQRPQVRRKIPSARRHRGKRARFSKTVAFISTVPNIKSMLDIKESVWGKNRPVFDSLFLC